MDEDDRSHGRDVGEDESVTGNQHESARPGGQDGDGDGDRVTADREVDNPGTDEAKISSELRSRVDGLSDAELRSLIRYADDQLDVDEEDGSTFAEGSESAVDDESTESVDEEVDEQPDGVPSKATRVVKEINDNRYYYWQWRDGDSVKSKYDRPADSE